MMSAQMTCTLPHGATADRKDGTKVSSTSTAITRRTRGARAVVSVPNPAPTSKTVSCIDRSAADRICVKACASTRKCCPQRLRGRTPNVRRTRAVPPGVTTASTPSNGIIIILTGSRLDCPARDLSAPCERLIMREAINSNALDPVLQRGVLCGVPQINPTALDLPADIIRHRATAPLDLNMAADRDHRRVPGHHAGTP